ncbi:ribonuclease H-like domain-containing protein [Tanacetum coccineum]
MIDEAPCDLIDMVIRDMDLELNTNTMMREVCLGDFGACWYNCHPYRTPVDTESKLGAEGTLVSDPTLYRSLAGALQWLTFTRLDLSFVIQLVCLFMHDPREPHLAALKRILRSGCDAGLAGCPTTRRSTSGYYVFLDNHFISWSSKRHATLSRSSVEAE